jgi:sarcosine oxidase delta subunit
MIVCNCDAELEQETGRCPYCGSFVNKDEEEYYKQMDAEHERQSEFDKRIGYKEFNKQFPNYGFSN